MTEIDTQQEEQSKPSLGPGDRLQAARIALGMTLEDLANKMHLSTEILNSLEGNHFDEITAPIFVKGYLRSYARIVNLDENEIIQQYTVYYTDEDPPINSTSNAAPEINADDARGRWLTYSLIILILVLLVTWWWNRYQQPAETLSLDTSVDETTVSASDESLPVSKTNLEQADIPTSFNEKDMAEAVTEESNEIEQTQAEFNQPTIEPQADPSPDQPEPVLVMDTEDSSEPEPLPVVVEEDINEPESQQGLVITVNADTWADIKDADGNKLVYDLLHSGEKIIVDGKPPFRAFLGNGYGVSLSYQGEEIDLSNRIKADNTARLNIGQ